MQQDYPHFEIIFVDDGSKDNTFERINEAFKNNSKVRAFKKQNGGKASALNYGIERANGDFLLCIDADTQLKKMPSAR
ncbi:glycosyltransferase family 2 protein [Niabella sp. W65]|nr:glycosyltransferase family 2 protein [Niabella sp. W65]MCH7367443.1 glycosyltransferase family 2 protein [Niabella sp. W65]